MSGTEKSQKLSAPRKGPFHARIWSKLLRFERSAGLLKGGDRVIVAVSGGADSVCLAHFLRLLGERRGLELRLLHLHHGLRGTSADRDARFVEELGRRLKVPVETVRIPVAALARRERRSLEDAGRLLRYRALAARAKAWGAGKVAVGHHLDDQAETVLLHLLRGKNPKGLAGMPARRALAPGVQLIRPLLALSRREIREYLAYHRLDWREDRTNRSLRFTRNWIRLRLLPLLEKRSPQIRANLAAVAGGVVELRRAFASKIRARGA